MAEHRWIFTKEEIINTPSRKCGIEAEKELNYRQQAANLIQDMGQRLNVTQLCINTAIVYMHRFYMFHSFTKFHRNSIATASLFLAAKVEEQPRKLEHVIKVCYMLLNRDQLRVGSEAYLNEAQDLVLNENILLQTLGFDITVDHPHSHVVRTCSLVKASKDLGQTSYFLATNSLHLTQMCLLHKSTVIACVCMHLACKWSDYQIPRSSEGKEWYYYVDKEVTAELLEELTQDFLVILDKCPSKLKRKILTWKAGGNRDDPSVAQGSPNISITATRPAPPSAAQGSANRKEQHNTESAMRRVHTEPILTQVAKSVHKQQQPPQQQEQLQERSDKPAVASLTHKEYLQRKAAEKERQQHHHQSKHRQESSSNSSSRHDNRAQQKERSNIFDKMQLPPSTTASLSDSVAGLSDPIQIMASLDADLKQDVIPSSHKPNPSKVHGQQSQQPAHHHHHSHQHHSRHSHHSSSSSSNRQASSSSSSSKPKPSQIPPQQQQPPAHSSHHRESSSSSAQKSSHSSSSHKQHVKSEPPTNDIGKLLSSPPPAQSMSLSRQQPKHEPAMNKPLESGKAPKSQQAVQSTQPLLSTQGSTLGPNALPIDTKSNIKPQQPSTRVVPTINTPDEMNVDIVKKESLTPPPSMSGSSGKRETPKKEGASPAQLTSPRIQVERDLLVHSERKKRHRLPSISVEDKERLSERRGSSPKILLEKLDSGADSASSEGKPIADQNGATNKALVNKSPANKDSKPKQVMEKIEEKTESSVVSHQSELPSSPKSGPLKLKLDLKSGTASPLSDSSASKSKHHKHHKKHKRHKHKHHKEHSSKHHSNGEEGNAAPSEGLPKLKIKIGGADPLETKEEPSLKVVFSKDRSSGHYSSGSHKHKHSSKESRKRHRSRSPPPHSSHHQQQQPQQAAGDGSNIPYKMSRTNSRTLPTQQSLLLETQENLNQLIEKRMAEIQGLTANAKSEGHNLQPPLPPPESLPPLPPSPPH